jgi:hypothetical protein
MPGSAPKSSPTTSPWSSPANPESLEKIKLKIVACFSSLFNGRQHTTFHHASTTQLPSKNHVQTLTFLKTPLKNTSKTA